MLDFLLLAIFFVVVMVITLVFSPNLRNFAQSLSLLLAIFWLGIGVIVQIFWEDLRPRMNLPIDRTLLGVIFFILFSYNFIRWRSQRTMQRNQQKEAPPRPRVAPRDYDPTFDFSEPDSDDAKPRDESKPPPPN